MRSRTALAALDQAIEKSLWSYLFRGKKTKARYIKPRPNTKAGGKEDFQPVRFVRRIGAGGLPIGESRPFRNSWRGASRDLYGAAKGIYKHRRRTMSRIAKAVAALDIIEKAQKYYNVLAQHPYRAQHGFARLLVRARSETAAVKRGKKLGYQALGAKLHRAKKK